MKYEKPYLYLAGIDMVFWKKYFMINYNSYFKMPIYLFWCPKCFLSIWLCNLIGNDAKISKNHIYTSEVWIWFFGNIALEVVFLRNISHQLATPCALVIIDLLHPEYIWVLPWKLEAEKSEKNISIPARYRYGFLEILLKTHPNRYAMHLHESNMCSFAEDISKTAKNNKKP